MEKRWQLKERPGQSEARLSRELDLPPLITRVLLQRGYEDTGQIASFLDSKLSQLPFPESMLNLDKAARLIIQAMSRSDSICVYGDYDVDGVTSTALLTDFFRLIGYPALHYLPDRMQDGYGFHKEAVEHLAEKGVRLIITVDCGISGNEACSRARELGISVIITDHHEIAGELPDADAIVNPHQEGCGFQRDDLAGVGIAFFLAASIRAGLVRQGKPGADRVDLKQFLDLVTLGTVSDVAPIVRTNRIMVRHGLKLIGDGMRPGIQALKEVAQIKTQNVLCGHVSFQLGPRINAAGRLGNAGLGVELLTHQDPHAVKRIAEQLDQENKKRQQIEVRILEEARKQFLDNPHHPHLHTIVLAGTDWHPGVIGIVASRILEEFYRPTILITFEGGIGRGSARSIHGFNLFAAIAACGQHLEGYGGHQYAAGIQVRPEKLNDFAVAFEMEARKTLSLEDCKPTLAIDAECGLEQIDDRLIKGLARLAPFGVGNPEPLFLTRDVRVEHKRIVGVDHLKLRLSRNKSNLSAIAFGLGDWYDRIGERIDIVYSAGVNEYQGQKEIQLTIKDLRPVD